MLDHAIDDDANDDALFRLSTDFSTPMGTGIMGMMGQPTTLSPSQSLDTNSPKIVRHIRLSLPGLEQTMAQGTPSLLLENVEYLHYCNTMHICILPTYVYISNPTCTHTPIHHHTSCLSP